MKQTDQTDGMVQDTYRTDQTDRTEYSGQTSEDENRQGDTAAGGTAPALTNRRRYNEAEAGKARAPFSGIETYHSLV